MTEDMKQKEVRLKKELAKVRSQNANEMRRITKNRDTTHKAKTSSNDVPDVVLLPQGKRGKKENIPF